VRQKFRVSERFACRVLGQHRSTQRKVPRGRPDEEALTADIIALASQYGRNGYRRITALLRDAGWVVNVKRVERLGRRRGGDEQRVHRRHLLPVELGIGVVLIQEEQLDDRRRELRDATQLPTAGTGRSRS
jgi:hypothetical protein